MSHLGIVSLISLATKNIQCFGFDLNIRLVNELKNNNWPIEEPGISEAYESSKDSITFTSDLTKLKECQIIYISQDVLTDNFGRSDLSEIENLIILAAQNIAKAARLVILCQVPPGFTRKMKKYHSNISYQVETLVFGEALSRASNPERIIIGIEEPSLSLDSNYSMLLESFMCPVITLNYESAEFTKISINAFLAASIITTNSLNEIGKSVGANWSGVKRALQLDRRIGEYAYLNPGLGISGGNIERDLQTLDELALSNDSGGVSIFRTYLNSSQRQKNWIIDTITENIINHNSKAKIGILGIAYKVNTSSTKNSIALVIAKKFSGNIIGAYDPLAVLPQDLSNIRIFDSLNECILAADAVVILTPWPEFSTLDFSQLAKENKEIFTIIDPYGICNSDMLPKNVKIKTLVEIENK